MRLQKIKLKNVRQKDWIPNVSFYSMKSLLTSWSTAISEFSHKKREEPRPVWKRFWTISSLFKTRSRPKVITKKSRKPSSKWEAKSQAISRAHLAPKSTRLSINLRPRPSLSLNCVTRWSQRFKTSRQPLTSIILSTPPKWISSKINLRKLSVSALPLVTFSKRSASKVRSRRPFRFKLTNSPRSKIFCLKLF